MARHGVWFSRSLCPQVGAIREILSMLHVGKYEPVVVVTQFEYACLLDRLRTNCECDKTC